MYIQVWGTLAGLGADCALAAGVPTQWTGTDALGLSRTPTPTGVFFQHITSGCCEINVSHFLAGF